jgi:hypothetical protein
MKQRSMTHQSRALTLSLEQLLQLRPPETSGMSSSALTTKMPPLSPPTHASLSFVFTLVPAPVHVEHILSSR